MTAPAVTAGELLDAWEWATGQPAVVRPLALASAVPPYADAADSIGKRDAHLLDLHDRVFGGTLHGLLECPSCAETIEVDVNVADVRARAAETGAVHTIRVGDTPIVFRVPTTDDLAAVQGYMRDDAVELLLSRCLLSNDGLPSVETGLAVDAAMVDADPQADIQLGVTCPACGHDWSEPFDIGGFVWQEVAGWAERTLDDVHAIARAYGWPEREVLALSPWRRRRYVELVGG